MYSEKNFSSNPEQEKEPTIIIKRSTDAPQEVKANPFYDPEFWGRGEKIDDIYLPDSDEGISFAIAAHEIGHLVDKDRKETGLDNFESQKFEEQRAWDVGWPYLEKYLTGYFQDKPEEISKIRSAFERIREIFAEAVNLSQGLYLERWALTNTSQAEREKILKKRREKFFTEKGEEFKIIYDRIKQEKTGIKPDWNRFTEIVTNATKDIIKDNEKLK